MQFVCTLRPPCCSCNFYLTFIFCAVLLAVRSSARRRGHRWPVYGRSHVGSASTWWMFSLGPAWTRARVLLLVQRCEAFRYKCQCCLRCACIGVRQNVRYHGDGLAWAGKKITKLYPVKSPLFHSGFISQLIKLNLVCLGVMFFMTHAGVIYLVEIILFIRTQTVFLCFNGFLKNYFIEKKKVYEVKSCHKSFFSSSC